MIGLFPAEKIAGLILGENAAYMPYGLLQALIDQGGVASPGNVGRPSACDHDDGLDRLLAAHHSQRRNVSSEDEVERRAGIVGAGIGGLAAGIAMGQAGWSVTVFERAPKLEAPGAGLSIWPNGVRALRALGLGELVKTAPRARGALRKADGKVLAEFETDAVEDAR